jgi:hypothetical protein
MRQAQRLKILPADEQQRGVIHRGAGSGIIPAVEYRKLCYRAARPVNGEHLFASARRCLENPDVAALHYVQTRAGLALGKYHLARRILPRYRVLRQKTQFGIGEPGENRNLRQGPAALGRSHSSIMARQ